MLIIPAIDLSAGRCVRWQQGRPDKETVFSHDPAAVAKHWEALGARWLHVVNLDGALAVSIPPTEAAGRPRGDELAGPGGRIAANLQAIQAIVKGVGIPVQLGGGLRDLKSINTAFSLGVARVVLGTVAVTRPEVVAQAIVLYGPERVAVGIDAYQGKVAVRGWQEVTGLSALELAERMKTLGVSRVVYTDIVRDGMLSGPNLPALRQMAATGLRVIASGGISCLDDLLALAAIPGIEGVIVGMALYTGAVDFSTALSALRLQGG